MTEFEEQLAIDQKYGDLVDDRIMRYERWYSDFPQLEFFADTFAKLNGKRSDSPVHFSPRA